ncbi:MAG: hypothetical protein DDT29_01109 [Dehalococcoidia bacterium]|nr:hypothetical protein [Bacillota bacterium]
MTAPKIMLASGSAASATMSAASLTSKRLKFTPPVMFKRTPRAPSIDVSNNGLAIAFFAASTVRLSPEPTPIPMRAAPVSFIIVFTSAKSKLIRPGTAIKSEMPCTPWRRTSSAMRNASKMGVRLSTTCSNLSFGMVINVSTFSLKLLIPFSATAARLRPSKVKGLVTTPTVSAPSSRASSAIIGVAPVPVPPPIPAVINTMSAPLSACLISSLLSSAACAPISGLAPAPRPLVNFSPICNLHSELAKYSACASVFTEINSTPRKPAAIIRLTALLPPPPTPITFI